MDKKSNILLTMLYSLLIIKPSMYMTDLYKDVFSSLFDGVTYKSDNDIEFIIPDSQLRLAFYVQSSGIKLDGSITKPDFFFKLSNDDKNNIILIKDLDKELLRKLLSIKIPEEDKKRFLQEISNKENSVILQSYKQR